MSKKKKTIEELLDDALVQEDEQLYDVPENWIWTSIENTIQPMETRDPKRLDEDVFHYIDVDAVDNKKQSVREVKVIETNLAPSRAKRKVSKNDVIISLVRPYLKNIAYIQEQDDKLVASTAFYVCTSKNVLDSNYLYYYLCSNSVTQYLISHTKGDNSPSVRSKDYEKMPIPIAPLNEQKRIAEKVERLLNKIEEAKQLIEETKETFELRRKSILKQALDGKLTEKWRKNESNSNSAYKHIQNAYDELKKTYDEQCVEAKEKNKPKPKKPEIFKHFSLVDKKIDGLPKWVNTTFIHLCVLQRGYDLPVHAREEGSYPIVSAGGIIDFHNEYKVKGPGVITGRSGTIGSVFYIEDNYMPLNTSLYVDYFNGNNPKFVYYYLLNFDFKSYSSSTAVPTLNRNNFFDTEVKVPPIDEQEIIVEMLDDFFDKEAEAYWLIVKVEDNLRELKQSILTKAFRGELGTNNPSEANAIELLKEILQEQVK